MCTDKLQVSSRYASVRLAWVCAAVLAAGLIGCDGVIDITSKTKVKVTIAWPALSQDLPQKAVLAPGSARTAVIKLTGAAPGGGDFQFSVARPADAAAVVQSYQSADRAVAGTYPLWIGFYTQSGDVMGSLVGQAYDTVTIASDGSGIADVAVQGTAARVEVVKGQSVNVGETKALAYTVEDGDGRLLAVDPASVFWGVAEGDRHMVFEAAEAVGVEHGSAQVAATVDGIASAPVAVQVTPVKRAMLIPLISGAPDDGANLASGISADGKVVVGSSDTASGTQHAFRWTEAGGTEDLGVLAGNDTSVAYRADADGSVVVGVCYLQTNADTTNTAFVWTSAEGMKPIEGFPEGTLRSAAYGVSADGTRVVGFFEINDPEAYPPMVGKYGFLWSQADGLKIFGDFLPPGVPRHDCTLWSISADGQIVVGAAGFDMDAQENPITGPVRWGQVGNVWDASLLGAAPNTDGAGEAYCVSADGSVVGGWTHTEENTGQPFRWTLTTGMIFPVYGQWLVMQACSHDGTFMAGSGGDPGNAFTWDVYRGYRNLYDVLDAEGILDGLEGQSPAGVMGLSADGQAMVGDCGPGVYRAFFVELPFVPSE